MSRLLRLICCQIIASSPGSLLICRSLALGLLVLSPSFAFRSSEVRRLLLDFEPCGGTDTLGMFPLFLKRTADVLAPRLSLVFGGFFVWVASLLAGDRPMPLQSRRVHRPPRLLIIDRFT